MKIPHFGALVAKAPKIPLSRRDIKNTYPAPGPCPYGQTKLSEMRKTIAIMAATLCMSLGAHSQTFLDHLQKDDKGGSVSVKQSDDISKLVNGGKKEANSPQEQRQESTPARSEGSQARSGESRSESANRERPRSSTREDEARDEHRHHHHEGRGQRTAHDVGHDDGEKEHHGGADGGADSYGCRALG